MKKRCLIKQIRLTQRERLRLAELTLNPPPRNERVKTAQARYQAMKRSVALEHVTPVGGNVFLDLGFPPEEAAQLKAEADAMIRDQTAG
ncbi:MAG: hypothetical protein CVU18_14640 [Betaproteobacteria bacterium HGW-Betaproteobacteria-12]|nr:MAG: hypothetical protein CVU18_14640 [Betaproteobacteria bacterium HGW-Betaproteobacteria-12]